MSAPRAPRLLLVVNVAWFFLSHRLAIALAARRAGYDVHVAAGGATEDEIQRIRSLGLEFHAISLRRSARSAWHDLALVRQLLRLYQVVRPDIVHHVTIKPVMFGTLAARLAGVPRVVNAVSGLGYVFTGNGASRVVVRSVVRLLYRACLHHPRMVFIFQNPDDRTAFERAVGITRSRSVLIPGSGVDLDEFKPTPEAPLPPFRVVLLARMLRDKGVCEFAEAARLLRARGVAIDPVLAGPLDPENPAALSLGEVRNLERSCGVRWAGSVSEVAELLGASHVVCLPSYREGLPRALIEAAAAGRPIVTTDVPGCRDVVEHELNGLLVAPADATALADALARLAGDAALRARMGAAGRARAEAEFGIERVVERTLAVYRQ